MRRLGLWASATLTFLALATVGVGTETAAAPKSALDEFKSARRSAEKHRKAYDADFQNAYMDAVRALIAPVTAAAENRQLPPTAVEDYRQFVELYAARARLADELGDAADALARSGHKKAVAVLFDLLLDTAAEIDDADESLSGPPNIRPNGLFDLRPGVERHGLSRRLERIQSAIVQPAGGVAYVCGDGWKKAAKKDGRRSLTRRIAIVDAVAQSDAPLATPFLVERLSDASPALRIAAMEALLPHGDDAVAAVAPLLDDMSLVVRYAVVQEIRRRAPEVRAWIAPLIASLPQTGGRLRDDTLTTLRTLTGHDFGTDPAPWQAWIEEHAETLATADLAAIGPTSPPPADTTPRTDFYGLRTASPSVVFLIDSSRSMEIPAEVDFLETEPPSFFWGGGTWEEQHPSNQTILFERFAHALNSMPEGTNARVIGMPKSSTDLGSLLHLEPIVAGKTKWKDLDEDLRRLPGRGATELLSGILGAYELAGLDPWRAAPDFTVMEADTVYLWHRGDPRYGRIITVEPLLATFKRLNRFRRLQFHTIRVANNQRPAERVMQGIAEESGGSYLWSRDLPGPRPGMNALR